MNQNHKSLHDELDKLNQDFSDLFNMTEKPKLSKMQKRKMLKNITKTKWQIPKFAIISFATAFAAFAILIGMAQISNPGDTLYSFKLVNKTQKTDPVTIQEVEQATKAVEIKQTEVQQLVKQNAEPKLIKKAETELNKAKETQKFTQQKFEATKQINKTESENKKDIENKDKTQEKTEIKKDDD